MSGIQQRQETLEKARQREVARDCVQHGIRFCETAYGRHRVLAIDLATLDQSNPATCMLAQCSGINYGLALAHVPSDARYCQGRGFASGWANLNFAVLTEVAKEEVVAYRKRHAALVAA